MTPEEASALAAIVESVDDAGGRITGTEVDHENVGGVASAMRQMMGGEPEIRPVFTLEIAAAPSEVLHRPLDAEVESHGVLDLSRARVAALASLEEGVELLDHLGFGAGVDADGRLGVDVVATKGVA